LAFHKRCDVAVLGAANQVACPVAWNGAIFDKYGPFADRHSIHDLAKTVAL
jgi:hypothetical protein